MHGMISIIHHLVRHHHSGKVNEMPVQREPVIFDKNPTVIMPKVAIIERDGEWFEYDFDAVESDPCYIHTGMYILLGIERHTYRFVPLPA